MAERLVRPSGTGVVAVSFEEPAASRNETPHPRKPLKAQFVSTAYPGHRWRDTAQTWIHGTPFAWGASHDRAHRTPRRTLAIVSTADLTLVTLQNSNPQLVVPLIFTVHPRFMASFRRETRVPIMSRGSRVVRRQLSLRSGLNSGYPATNSNSSCQSC